jgi:hypothetical protein
MRNLGRGLSGRLIYDEPVLIQSRASVESVLSQWLSGADPYRMEIDNDSARVERVMTGDRVGEGIDTR